jgi:N-dimethylarginine dimethylaminohydrolase
VKPLRARKEWLSLARAIEDLGGTVVVLEPPDETLTGLPYAAEAGHVLPPRRGGSEWRFLLPSMLSPHRQREKEAWAPLARSLGFDVLDPGGGVWEGQGDVAEFAGVTVLFFGGRTDRGGLDAARREFEGETLVLELREPAFHGNMAVLPLPAVDRLLVCPDVIVGDGMARLTRRFESSRILAVSEDEIRSYATNGLPVGDTWLAPSVVPERVKELVEGAGMRVVTLPMRELCEKAGGASRCLVCRAAAPVPIPEAQRLARVEREISAEPDDG